MENPIDMLRHYAGILSRASNSLIVRKAQDLQKHPGDHDQSVHNPHGGEGAGEAKEQPSERGRKEGERIGSAANDLVEHLKEMEGGKWLNNRPGEVLQQALERPGITTGELREASQDLVDHLKEMENGKWLNNEPGQRLIESLRSGGAKEQQEELYDPDEERERRGAEDPDIGKVIRQEGDKWTLYSKDGSKKLGTFDSKNAAINRERQIQYFKHRKGMIESLRDAVSKLSQRRID